jgi:hypothetical protein
MKGRWLAAFSVASLLAGLAASPPVEPDAVVVFTGDIRGYLSPCGCSEPMIGGAKRMAGVVRQLKKQPKTIYVDAGNWLDGVDRQEQLKAETLAQVWASLPADYVNVSTRDLQLGESYIDALRVVAPAIASTDLAERRVAGVTVYGRRSASDGGPVNTDRVVLVSAPLANAKRIAESDGPGLYIYSLQGDPPAQPTTVDGSTFVTVGDHCRYVGRIELKDGKWTNFKLIELGPEHENDAQAALAYAAYLRRVSEENLLAEIPKHDRNVKFVGSETCVSCHYEAGKAWKHSLHAAAYRTLEKTGNHRDPECVGCHVVGLDDKSGFISKQKTPNLAAVGCESCHGAGSNHLKSPYRKYRTLGERTCLPCHTTANSPHFDFKEYWAKIKH